MAKHPEITSILAGYSYNCYEMCRIFNGHDKDDFKPCYMNRTQIHDRCNRKLRGCPIPSMSLQSFLRTMEKNGEVHSIKLRWFDKGRKTNGLCTDSFRFYYMTKEGLANRLMDDIKIHLLSGGPLA